MKVVIAGSRNFKKYDLIEQVVEDVIKRGINITEVVSGGARGVDTMGEAWAVKKGVNVKRYPAEWNKYGLSAGPIRNRQMGDYADALIAIWDGTSSGTKNMIDYAKEKNLLVFVYIVKQNGEWHAVVNN